MKILIIASCYKPTINGVTTNIEMIVNALKKEGHYVKVLCPKHKSRGIDKDVIEISSIRNPLDQNYPIALTFRIPKEIKKEKFDIVHLHQPFTVRQMAIKIAKKQGIPLIFTNHTQYIDYVSYYPIVRIFLKFFVKLSLKNFYKSVDLIITATEEIKNSIKALTGNTKIKVIPIPINDRVLKERITKFDIRKRFNVRKKDFLFLYLGRVAREKNIKTLMKAFTEATKNLDNIKLLIIGPGDYKKTIHNTNPSIIFGDQAKKEELHNYYSQSDFFVSASTSETFGLVFAEAAFIGLPLLGMDSPGVRKIIKNGKNGFLAKNYSHFVSLLNKIAKNRTTFPEKEVRDTVKKYTSEQNIKILIQTYKDLIQNNLE